jgi:hypothetical protein
MSLSGESRQRIGIANRHSLLATQESGGQMKNWQPDQLQVTFAKTSSQISCQLASSKQIALKAFVSA